MHNVVFMFTQMRHAWLLALLMVLWYAATAQTVYITRTGEKYHQDSCRYLSNSKISVTLDSAATKGYTACKVCKPASGTTQKVITTPSSSSVQCSGITKAGARCKRTTTNASGRCYQH